MIDARELRIGNLVEMYLKTSTGLTEIHEVEPTTLMIILGLIDSRDVRFKPIPLTEQWLIDFGFEKGHKLYLSPDKSSDEGFFTTMCYNLWEKDFIINDNDYDCRHVNCEYVHQLQNLYFALTGEELTNK